MQDRTGELCPSCKKGKLRPTGNREVKEPDKSPTSGEAQREFTEYECDTCGHTCNAFGCVLSDSISFRSDLRGKVREQSGHIATKFVMREKLNKYGKEAKELLHIDSRGNRKIHHVEEKDEKGDWKVVHHEDEPLKKRKGENV